MGAKELDSGAAQGPEEQSLLELFARETEAQLASLVQRLLQLEQSPGSAFLVDDLMRTLHSIKGAARVVGLDPIVWVTHALEDCLGLVREGRLSPAGSEVDVMLRAVDGIQAMAREAPRDLAGYLETHRAGLRDILDSLARLVVTARGAGTPVPAGHPASILPEASGTGTKSPGTEPGGEHPPAASAAGGREFDPAFWTRRWNTDRLNRLMGLAGEALANVRWLAPFVEKVETLRSLHAEAGRLLGCLRTTTRDVAAPHPTLEALGNLEGHWARCAEALDSCCDEIRAFDRRTAQWSHQLYLEVLLAKVRPFAEAVRRLPRLVRDLGRNTGKEVRLIVEGEATRVDGEILERVEQILLHLVRNAVDHGCETREERRRLGKPLPAVIRVEAGLEAHELWVRVTDDGRGIDLHGLRQYLVRSGRATEESVTQWSQAALVELLFEPGLSLKEKLTPDSGRGVGLDVVRQMVQEMRGRIQVQTHSGQGTSFELRLPLTLSVVRAVLVEAALEVYAFPLNQVERVIRLLPEDVETVSDRSFVRLNGQTVPLVSLAEVLGLEAGVTGSYPWWVLVVRTAQGATGWLVDQCLGERELLLQPVDRRLGRLPGVSGAAVLEDGRPVLLVAPPELITLAQSRPEPPPSPQPSPADRSPGFRPRVLAVDDAASVREMARRLLTHHGYDTDTASNGWEAWQALDRQRYDLVLTDLEMPGLDGLELSRRIRRDERFCHLPIVLMSWRGDESERQRGYEAGANAFIPKDAQTGRNLVTTVQRLLARV
jgi:two-component system sensor histidine kinase and response regulator WspE